jgi:hypothetical protein
MARTTPEHDPPSRSPTSSSEEHGLVSNKIEVLDPDSQNAPPKLTSHCHSRMLVDPFPHPVRLGDTYVGDTVRANDDTVQLPPLDEA